jgi:Protein of unknown function (DUF1569)
MRTLANPSDYELLITRLRSISPQDTARWGRMNVSQMLLHLDEAIRVPLGDFEVSEHTSLVWQTVMKWAALWYPRAWPQNISTRPELDLCQRGIYSDDFETARSGALTQLTRLYSARLQGVKHPFFGSLSRREWMRWGWLHTDHHLRQFGR